MNTPFSRIAVLLGALSGGVAFAEPAPLPDLTPAARRAIDAPYLDADRREDAAMFHGVWDESGGLWKPERIAQAALQAGWLDDDLFTDPDADPEQRAVAAAMRGDVDTVMSILHGAGDKAEPVPGALTPKLLWSLTKSRIDGGMRVDDRVIEETRASIADRTLTHDDLVWLARLEALLLEHGPADADRYRSLVARLAELRLSDQLDWRVRLLEAKVLLSKDNHEEASQALGEVLTLNPRSGEAWRLAGEAAVASLDADRAGAIADRLDALAQEAADADDVTHPWGELVRARMALRLSDAEGAEAALDRALSRWPEWREGLAWRAAADAADHDLESAGRRLAELDARMPGAPLGPLTVGAVLAEDRQYAEAAAFLEQATDRAPHRPEPWIELGLLEMQSGRDAQAFVALGRAVELDPFNVRAANSHTLIEELLEYDVIETEHFRIRFRPGVDEAAARDFAAHAEPMHEFITETFGYEPEQPTTVELMPDHEWFAVRVTGMPGIFTIAASTGPVVAMEAPKIGKINNGEYHWLNVLQHEYVHTVTLAQTRNRIPHWFTEACAVNFQGDERDWDTWQLLASALESGELFGPVKLNLAFVRPEKPTDRPQAYAQAAWIYEWIIERWGEAKIRGMLDRQREGLTEHEVIRAVFGMSFEDFLADFELWAAEDLVRHGVRGEPALTVLQRDVVLDGLAADHARDELASMGRSVADRIAGRRSRLSDLEAEPAEISEDILVQLLEEHPAHPELLAQAVAQQQEMVGGDPAFVDVGLLERLAEAQPVNPLPHRALARLYRDRGEPQRAIPHLEWLDIRDNFSWAYAAELARLYASAGDHERAYAKAERATIYAPYRAEHREIAAAAAIRAGELDHARRHLQALTLLEPDRDIHRKRLEAFEQRFN